MPTALGDGVVLAVWWLAVVAGSSARSLAQPRSGTPRPWRRERHLCGGGPSAWSLPARRCPLRGRPGASTAAGEGVGERRWLTPADAGGDGARGRALRLRPPSRRQGFWRESEPPDDEPAPRTPPTPRRPALPGPARSTVYLAAPAAAAGHPAPYRPASTRTRWRLRRAVRVRGRGGRAGGGRRRRRRGRSWWGCSRERRRPPGPRRRERGTGGLPRRGAASNRTPALRAGHAAARVLGGRGEALAAALHRERAVARRGGPSARPRRTPACLLRQARWAWTAAPRPPRRCSCRRSTTRSPAGVAPGGRRPPPARRGPPGALGTGVPPCASSASSRPPSPSASRRAGRPRPEAVLALLILVTRPRPALRARAPRDSATPPSARVAAGVARRAGRAGPAGAALS